MTPFPSDAPPAPVRSVGTVLAGCRIEAVLSVGPVCTVYQAGDAVGAGRFAVKEYCPAALCVRDEDGTPRLRDPADLAARALFEAGRAACLEELRLLSRLRLPGLVPVLQASEAQGSLCGVMPLLPGVTLDRLAPAHSDEEVRELMLALLEPLAQVHAAGLVHGGLHARQLLWTLGQRPVLLGFGAGARALRLPEAFDGAAPELRPEGAHLPRGPWTDLYALAATVLRHTTSGAWDGSGAASDVAVALAQALPSPGGRTRQALVQALQACLRSSPTERPAGAVALRALLADGPGGASQTARAAPSWAGTPPKAHSMPSRTDAPQAAHPASSQGDVPLRPVTPPASASAGAAESPEGPAWAAPEAEPGWDFVEGHARDGPATVAAGMEAAAGDGQEPVPGAGGMAGGRRSSVLRALVLGLPLLAALGWAAWWAQDQWQAAQERERVSRLVARAAVQSQASGVQASAPTLPASVQDGPERTTGPVTSFPAGTAPAAAMSASGVASAAAEAAPVVDAGVGSASAPDAARHAVTQPSRRREPEPRPVARAAPQAAVATPAPALPATPLAACVTQSKSALARCMRQQCSKPAWRGHVQCERLLEEAPEGGS